jgi:hypothetical protein
MIGTEGIVALINIMATNGIDEKTGTGVSVPAEAGIGEDEILHSFGRVHRERLDIVL